MRRFLTASVVLLLFLLATGSDALLAQATKTPSQSADHHAAAPATKEEVEALRSAVAAQQQTIEELRMMVQQLVKQQASGEPQLVNAAIVQSQQGGKPLAVAQKSEEQPSKKIQRIPGDELKFSVGGGEVQLYGHADVSFDYVDNGITAQREAGPEGPLCTFCNNGWLAQVSSNLSYFGFRGERKVTPWLTGIFQVETEIPYSATPGPTTDAQVKAGWGSRDTFVGVKGDWGAIKIGKEDAPYKRTKARLDPFINSIGDSRSIMGNSGGDNRAEFDTRIPHALWYESPTYKGFYTTVLFSPGQNRAIDNSVLARPEPNCTGGNDAPCTDGGAGNQLSAAVTYTNGPFYAVVAYEHHAKVNRTGDEAPDANGIIPSVGVADESAFNVGAQYRIKPTRTTVNFIYENLKRYAAALPGFSVDPRFNERTRPLATWLAVTQQITPKDDFNVGWAHAGRTPGDPGGQINQPIPSVLNLAGPIDNRSNLIDVGLKHRFDKKMTTYFVFARQMNHQGAHYDLGANGHGAVVDRADAAGNSFTGRTHTGVSGGLTYDF